MDSILANAGPTDAAQTDAAPTAAAPTDAAKTRKLAEDARRLAALMHQPNFKRDLLSRALELERKADELERAGGV
jgi:hypothetical protein